MSGNPGAAAVGAGPPLVLLAAVARNCVIGDGLSIPWRLGTDLRRFRRLTLGKPVVMGRRTFQSLGRPLPERVNVVVSADPAFSAEGVVLARSLEAALAAARAALPELACGVAREICVAGGARLYAETLPLADRLELTRVAACPAGEVRFPQVDWSRFRLVAREEHPTGPRDDHPFAFETWVRAQPAG